MILAATPPTVVRGAKRTYRGLFTRTLVLAALLSASCGSSFMHAATAPTAKSRDLAYVCFLRPSHLGAAHTFDVFDEQRRFLGEAVAGSHWTVAMTPGEHWVYSLGENVTVLNANLVAGRTYYVVVRPRIGVWEARVQLTALAPRTQEWEELPDWLADSDELVADINAGQAALDKDSARIQEKMVEAIHVWRSMSPGEQELHTLKPTDGSAF